MAVRAKFKVNEKRHTENGQGIKLGPVYGNTEENKKFFAATPSGNIDIFVTTDVADQFELGKEYYIDFTLALATPVE